MVKKLESLRNQGKNLNNLNNMLDIKDKINNTFDSLKEEFSYKNKFQAPKLEKIILSVGAGRDKGDKKKIAVIVDRLTKIAGQKPSPSLAKKSVAAFKLREGEVIGFKTTLRGSNMDYFFEKFISIVIPRMKDFRGISEKSIDEMGNLTIGIKEHIIFPETGDEEINDIFGLAVTIVSTATNKEEALAFFKHLGVPFKKEEK